MKQIELRIVIKFLTKQGKIMSDKTMIYKLHSLFKQGRDSIEDDPRPERPIEITTPDIIEKVENLILEDARLKKKQLSALVGVSHTTSSARWVPRTLTPPQKQQRVEASKEFLKLCADEPTPILGRIVTGDETWVHHFEPESDQESMQWHKKGTPPPKKFKVSESSGN